MLRDLGLNASDTPRIARALGVSTATIWRWKRTNAPRAALLALWWLSREGYSVWDCEMANRTSLALKTLEAMWRQLRSDKLALRSTDLRPVGQTYGPPANERRFELGRQS